MKLIDEILVEIERDPSSRFSAILARALASVCSRYYQVSLLDASVLHGKHHELYIRLTRFTEEKDYSTNAQDVALLRLRNLRLIE